MFSLIISIIAIALVAALAGASVYYGGAAFNKGTSEADASTFMNAGQQVNGAFSLAAADGDDAATLAELMDETGPVYLTQVPSYKGTAVTLSGDYVTVAVTQKVAEALFERGAADFDGVQSGLLGVDSATMTAYYKVK